MMARYDLDVRGGLKAANTLAAVIHDDLDIDGIAWWSQYAMSPETRACLSHYVVGAPAAISANLNDAAAHLSLYQDRTRAEDNFIRMQTRAAGGGVPNLRDRNDLDALRAALIPAEVGAFFRAVGSVLDTMAATVIGIAALDFRIVKANWGTLKMGAPEDSYPRLPGQASGPLRKSLACQGTNGGYAQESLLKAVRAATLAAGPRNWATWTLDTRNSMVHRSRWMSYTVREENRRSGTPTFIRPLPRNPALAEGRAMREIQELADIVLTEDAATTMQGVLGSVVAIVQAVAEQCVDLWKKRRTQPSLLVQPASQWTDMERIDFEGYAPDSGIAAFRAATAMYMAPEDQQRIASLKPRADKQET